MTEAQKKKVEKTFESAMLNAALEQAERLGNEAGCELVDKMDRQLRALFADSFKAALKREVKRLAEDAVKHAHIEVER